MRIVIIDNFDSFTFNLYQRAGEILLRHRIGTEGLCVIRNHERSVAQIQALKPERIILSPGPGNPADSAYFGVCSEVIDVLGPHIPMLGVCLGMQGIALRFGSNIVLAPEPKHGKTSPIVHTSEGLFAGMPQKLEVMRYHSLMIEASSLGQDLIVTGIAADDSTLCAHIAQAALNGHEIMSIRHRHYPIEGVQFHPESFATEGGMVMLENFLLQKYRQLRA